MNHPEINHSTSTPLPQPGAPQRRQLLWGGAVAVVAAATGAGWAWRSTQPDAPGGQVEAAVPGFWGLAFDQPSGGRLAFADYRGRQVLLNFWATWCPPCVEELPLLDRFFQEGRAQGRQVIGLAVDQSGAVARYLARSPLSFPVALAGTGGTELVRALGNRVGGLPFSVLIGPDGRVLQRKMGQITPGDLAHWFSGS